MVVKIEPKVERIDGAQQYNERKMSGPEHTLSEEELQQYNSEDNTGHVLATRNVPEGSSLENEFSRLKYLNMRSSRGRKLEYEGFHMSVNPNQGSDRPLSEDEVVEFIDEVMKKLGYGKSPYRIYKHNDIEREHFHVVSTRIGQDGKKIDDAFENRRCNRIIEKLAEKYGFTVGLEENGHNERLQQTETQEKENVPPAAEKPSESPKTGKEYIRPFDIGAGKPLSTEMKVFHEQTMKWNFSTPEQYAMIMKRRFNVEAEAQDNGYCFWGLDDKGLKATKPLTGQELGLDIIRAVEEKCRNTKMSARKAQRERLEKEVRLAAQDAATMAQFRKALSKKGITAVIHWTQDGKPFGLTWLDRATRCAWKASETDVTLDYLKGLMEEKNWKSAMHSRYERKEKKVTRNEPSAGIPDRKKNESLLNKWQKEAEHQARALDGTVGGTHRSNEDASKNRDRTLDDPNDIII